MKELLPVVLGILVGTGAALVSSTRLRSVLLPVGSIVAGVCASAINGELATEQWAVFVSFDMLLVWLCALGSCAAVLGLGHLRRRRNAASGQTGSG